MSKSKIIINGKKPLYGHVNIAGMKNAALPILYATVLVKGTSRLENLPDTEDIRITLTILESLGADIKIITPECVEICTDGIKDINLSTDLARKLRASYYLLGAGLARFGSASVGYPGGCEIGSNVRPIDQHIAAFESLGASVKVEGGKIIASSPEGLSPTVFSFKIVTVGATINLMLASVFTEGLTVIEGAAREPHIIDLANFLNNCGASITGAGTDVIKIRGVNALSSSTYEIAPDMIEAGTYMAAAAAAGGCVEVRNVIPTHLEDVIAVLRDMGVTVDVYDDSVKVTRDPDSPLSPTLVRTAPYPGFPTDMQPQICAVMCLANGISFINESVWNNRFVYVNELLRMGARISVNSNSAMIEGGYALSGAEVKATDLRGGAAVVIAALSAEGESTVTEIGHIERGYDNIAAKLASLGADIKRISE